MAAAYSREQSVIQGGSFATVVRLISFDSQQGSFLKGIFSLCSYFAMCITDTRAGKQSKPSPRKQKERIVSHRECLLLAVWQQLGDHFIFKKDVTGMTLRAWDEEKSEWPTGIEPMIFCTPVGRSNH